jgi:hypothetical protein
MKRAVSISLASSKRDKKVIIKFKDESIRVERIGTDGDNEEGRRLKPPAFLLLYLPVFLSVSLFCIIYRARLADDCHLNLAGILHGLFDFLGDIARQAG